MPITNAPNNATPGNRANSSGPIARQAGDVRPSNSPADRRNGTMPPSGSTGAVRPPDHRGMVGYSGAPTAAPMYPGGIPVEMGHGGPVGGTAAPTELDMVRSDTADALRNARQAAK